MYKALVYGTRDFGFDSIPSGVACIFVFIFALSSCCRIGALNKFYFSFLIRAQNKIWLGMLDAIQWTLVIVIN